MQKGVAVDVVVAAAVDFGGVVAALFHCFEEELQGVEIVFAAGEVDFAGFGMDAFEEDFHLVDIFNLAGTEA